MPNPKIDPRMHRRKPIFPVEYGRIVGRMMDVFFEMSERINDLTNRDISRVHDMVDSLEKFLMYFINKIDYKESEYVKYKEDLMTRIDRQETNYGQLVLLKEWFGELQKFVGPLYYDVSGRDEVDFNS